MPPKLHDLIENFFQRGDDVMPSILSAIKPAMSPLPKNLVEKRHIVSAMQKANAQFESLKFRTDALEREKRLIKTFLDLSPSDLIEGPERARKIIHDLIQHLDTGKHAKLVDSLNILKLYCSNEIHRNLFFGKSRDESEKRFGASPEDTLVKKRDFYSVKVSDEKLFLDKNKYHFNSAIKALRHLYEESSEKAQKIQERQLEQYGHMLRNKQNYKALLNSHMLLNPNQSEHAWMYALFMIPTIDQYVHGINQSAQYPLEGGEYSEYEFSSERGFSTPAFHSALYGDKLFPCSDSISGVLNTHTLCSYQIEDLDAQGVGQLRAISERFVRHLSVMLQSARDGADACEKRIASLLDDCFEQADQEYRQISSCMSVAASRKFIDQNGKVKLVSAIRKAAVIVYVPGEDSLTICASPSLDKDGGVAKKNDILVTNIVIPEDAHILQLSQKAWELIQADRGNKLALFLKNSKESTTDAARRFFQDQFRNQKTEWVKKCKSILAAREACWEKLKKGSTVHDFCKLNPTRKADVQELLAFYGEQSCDIALRTKSFNNFLATCVLRDKDEMTGFVTLNSAKSTYIDANHSLLADTFMPSLATGQVAQSQKKHIYFAWLTGVTKQLKTMKAECDANKKFWLIKKKSCKYRTLKAHLENIEKTLNRLKHQSPSRSFVEARDCILLNWQKSLSSDFARQADVKKFISLHMSRLILKLGESSNIFGCLDDDSHSDTGIYSAENRVFLELMLQRVLLGEKNTNKINSVLKKFANLYPDSFLLKCYFAANSNAELPSGAQKNTPGRFAKGLFFYFRFCKDKTRTDDYNAGVRMFGMDQQQSSISKYFLILFDIARGVDENNIYSIIKRLVDIVDDHPEAYINLCQVVSNADATDIYLRKYFSDNKALPSYLHKLVFLLEIREKIVARSDYCHAFSYRKKLFDNMDNILATEFDRLIMQCELGDASVTPQHLMAYAEYFWHKYHCTNAILPLLDYCLQAKQPAAFAICAEMACRSGQTQFLRIFARRIAESDATKGAKEYALGRFGELLHHKGHPHLKYHHHYEQAKVEAYLPAVLRSIDVNTESFQIDFAPKGLPGLEPLPEGPRVLILDECDAWRETKSDSVQDVFYPIMRNRPLGFMSRTGKAEEYNEEYPVLRGLDELSYVHAIS